MCQALSLHYANYNSAVPKGAIAESSGWAGAEWGGAEEEEGKRRGRGELPGGNQQQHVRVWVGGSESSHFLLPFPLVLPERFLFLLTVLSKPSVISMRKKMMAKKVAAGMLAMASAYVMKRRLGPETGRQEEVDAETQPTKLLPSRTGLTVLTLHSECSESGFFQYQRLLQPLCLTVCKARGKIIHLENWVSSIREIEGA